jgi:two-component system chemotaxis response regulator CheB
VKRTRVVVVEDSLTVRRMLCDIVTQDPDLELVGEAADGKQAIELCARLRPDVVTLDMMLPVLTGLAATEYIMAHCPTPILIVSASTNRGELFHTYDALAAGAVDVLEKPTGSEPAADWASRFLGTLKLVARIKVITHPRGKLRGDSFASAELAALPGAQAGRVSANGGRPVLAIGASTGGPAAIVQILRGLPARLPAAMLFVIHIDEPFGSAFAEWLDAQTVHRVAYARDGDLLSGLNGRVAMAPPGSHLVVEGARLRLSASPARHSCRPSIDILFESLAVHVGATAIAALLTGMGRDGADGLLAIRRAGGATLAQDEATSVVYGMPREAALLGAAHKVLPLSDIAPELLTLVAQRTQGSP